MVPQQERKSEDVLALFSCLSFRSAFSSGGKIMNYPPNCLPFRRSEWSIDGLNLPFAFLSHTALHAYDSTDETRDMPVPTCFLNFL